MRVAAVQCKVGVVDTFKSALDLIKEGVENNVELFLLPEYFSYQRGDDFSEKTKETLKFLKNTSREYSCTICGNVLIKQENKYFNTAHLFKEGELIGTQEKIHPTKTERELKISCGSKVKTFSINSIRLAILICADILYPELCRVAGLKKADIVLNPVVSFKKTELPAEKLRNYLYFTRSFDNAYAVVKAGGVGYTFLAQKTVGRSLISTFDGIVASYSNEEKEELVHAEIDIEKIRQYRKLNYSLHDRNVIAYAELLNSEFDC
ncbi:carbon-nitrogen hydrolase family protein [Archaeoglobales archaeon]|nr:MAG: carbon-nitrogen hydrolase family protein [Archaeoglobales archaeon]